MMQAPFGWSSFQNTPNFNVHPASDPACTDYVWDIRNSSINGTPSWQQPLGNAQQSQSEPTPAGQSWQQVVPNAMPWSNVAYSSAEPLNVVQFTGVPNSGFGSNQPINAGSEVPFQSNGPDVPQQVEVSTMRDSFNIPPEIYLQYNPRSVPAMGINSKTRNLKRRLQDIERERLTKRVRVNEERMSSGLEQLCLDSQLDVTKVGDDQPWCGDCSAEVADGFSERVDDSDLDSNRDINLPRLHLSKELIRSLRSNYNPLSVSKNAKDIVSRMAMEELNKPCMQLVLWKPLTDIIPGTSDTSTENENDTSSTGSNIEIESSIADDSMAAQVPMSFNPIDDLNIDPLPTTTMTTEPESVDIWDVDT